MDRAGFIKRAAAAGAAFAIADLEMWHQAYDLVAEVDIAQAADVADASVEVMTDYANLDTHLELHSTILRNYYLPVVREQLNNHIVLMLEEANGQ